MSMGNNTEKVIEIRVGNYNRDSNDRSNTRPITDKELNSLAELCPSILDTKMSMTPFSDLNNLSIQTSCSAKGYRIYRQIDGVDKYFICLVLRPLPNEIRLAFSPNKNIWQKAYEGSGKPIDVFDKRFEG